MDDMRTAILLGIATELGKLELDGEDLRVDPVGGDRLARGRLRLEIQEARTHGVRTDLTKWFGREPTAALRQRFHRELVAMEREGLLERTYGSFSERNCNRVRLTPAGRRKIEEICPGLLRKTWTGGRSKRRPSTKRT